MALPQSHLGWVGRRFAALYAGKAVLRHGFGLRRIALHGSENLNTQ